MNSEPLNPVSSKITILVVDDNPTNLIILHSIVRRMGFRVLIAEDGRSALERAEMGRPHLILLDVMMPGMDGFETCKKLKANPTTSGIPVIFLSALTDAAYRRDAEAAGAVDYISKPIQPKELLDKVKKYIPQSAQAAVGVLSSKYKPKNWLPWIDALAHDLRGQLTIAEGYLDILKETCDGVRTDPQEVREYVQTVSGSVAHMNRIIESLVTIRSLSDYKLNLTTIEPEASLRMAIEELNMADAVEWLNAPGDRVARSLSDPILLESALKSLLWTAHVLRAGNNLSPILLQTEILNEDWQLRLEVQGRQLSERECKALFSTNIERKEGKVAGVGINMIGASAIFDLLAIRVNAYPVDGGTRFNLSIPCTDLTH